MLILNLCRLNYDKIAHAWKHICGCIVYMHSTSCAIVCSFGLKSEQCY